MSPPKPPALPQLVERQQQLLQLIHDTFKELEQVNASIAELESKGKPK